jgi:hypothetical protein
MLLHEAFLILPMRIGIVDHDADRENDGQQRAVGGVAKTSQHDGPADEADRENSTTAARWACWCRARRKKSRNL